MIIKAVTLFLIAMGVLGMFGKFRPFAKQRQRLMTKKCRTCGAPRIGGTCPCDNKG